MTRYLSISALAVAAAIALAGCGSNDNSSTAPSPGTDTSSTADPNQNASDQHNGADVMFTQMMIPHHRQAVEMSEIILAKDSVSPEVHDLATRIEDAQGPEIETMTGWLDSWGVPTDMADSMEGHDMGGSSDMQGMMTEDQIGELKAADGEAAAKMFLTSMTAHHDGAVEMAQDEIEDGQYPDAIALAEAIMKSQRAEIEEMKALLADL